MKFSIGTLSPWQKNEWAVRKEKGKERREEGQRLGKRRAS